MFNWRLPFILAALVCVSNGASPRTSSKSTAAERVDRYQKLLVDYFASPRHPFYNGENLAQTRSGLLSEFEKILYNVPNTTMEIHHFKAALSVQNSPTVDVHGQNIIVTFNGRNTGTIKDHILVIGAHYDSERTPILSIADNGSGVVAMLEVARGLADAIVKRKAVLHNTLIFVAFDVQLFELDGQPSGFGQPGGSKFYVEEKLAPLLEREPKPTFLGAIILDSVMNYNNTSGSQILPNGFDTSFPEAYGPIKSNSLKGNYIAMVTKERLRSLQLDYVIAQQWNKSDTQRKFPMAQMEIRRSAASPALFEFLKQDHVPFWNHEKEPLPAVLLTDTSKWRGIQRLCGETVCNSTSLLTPDRLEMLDQVVMTLNNFILETHLDDRAKGSASLFYSSLPATILIFLIAYLL